MIHLLRPKKLHPVIIINRKFHMKRTANDAGINLDELQKKRIKTTEEVKD